MPVWDLICKDCGYERDDKFFATIALSEVPQRCPDCRGILDKKTPTVCFQPFKPFFTRNIRKDGSEVYVRDRAQLRQLMREEHLVFHPYNDSPESKMDPREKQAAEAEARKRFPARYKKLTEDVAVLTKEKTEQVAVKAPNFGLGPDGRRVPTLQERLQKQA